MKNKKIVTLIATLGLITCLYNKVDAVKFYDTMGTRYEGAVERLGALEIINGVSDKTFAPNKTVTRAEFTKMLVESSLTDDEIWALTVDNSKCTFKDVSKDKWYYDYVVAAVNYGYIKGYEDNTFRPDDEVTYEQIAKMLTKALGHEYLVDTNPNGWSTEYMEKMYSLNISDGTVEFEKGDAATRGNIAIMLWNTLTSNVWEKVELNDTNGFTYVDSGRTLINKKIRGHIYKKNFEINGFREINGKLYVRFDNTYYQLYDQDSTILFSMLGGRGEALLKLVRYPQNVYQYEIVGLSSDIGFDLYTGTLDEFKEDGNPVKAPIYRVGSNADYAYVIKSEKDKDNSRAITVNSQGNRFVVEKIKIDTDREEVEKDEEEVIKDIEKGNYDYVYKKTDETLIKTITINEEYEIHDGAVLFENNKRVHWNSVKKGDIITEIKKDQYYFVSREKVEATINSYKKFDDYIEFSTNKGLVKVYNNADFIGFYEDETDAKPLKRLKDDDLNSLIDVKVSFDLDFTGSAVIMEVLEKNITEEEKESEKEISDLKEIGVGCFVDYVQSGTDNFYISLFMGEKKKTYKTTIKSFKADYGDMILLKFNDRNVVTSAKVISSSTKITDKFTIKKETYAYVENALNKNKITDKIPVYSVKYSYDFGEYDKIVDIEMSKVTKELLTEIDSKKAEYYVVTDDNGNIKTVILIDYTQRKDIFYGVVDRIYSEDKKMKIVINVFEHKDVTYTVSGRLNCEEGDVVSFKIGDKDTIQILEKYSNKVLGYYKDLIVEEIGYKNKITCKNGEIYLDEGRIIADKVEHKISQYEIILLNLKKDDKGNWIFAKGDLLESKNIKLAENDRIAINEIEDTIIIYRGYKD